MSHGRASLVELQRELVGYLLAGDHAASLARRIRETPGVSSEQRLDVYRNAYYTRLQEALAHNFPVLLAVAGDRAFGSLATAYLADHPSTRPSLRWVGQDLPSWLRRCSDRPHLSDVAAIEWAVLHAFDAADAPTVPAASIAELAADQWPELRVTLHPSVRFVTVATNARELWSATRSAVARPGIRAVHEPLVVSRSDRGPAVAALSPTQYAFLSTMAAGATFAGACAVVSALAADHDVPHLAAHSLLDALLRGWISAANP